MTREEEIAVAFNDYRDALKLSTFGDFEYIDIQEAFEAGAKWADQHPNNVWHDASEEPKDDLGKDDLVIIYQDKHGDCWFITKRDIVILYINWERFATVSVRCWAYINDLLPKQFGNPEQLKGGET